MKHYDHEMDDEDGLDIEARHVKALRRERAHESDKPNMPAVRNSVRDQMRSRPKKSNDNGPKSWRQEHRAQLLGQDSTGFLTKR